jgi:hypothetical protein
VYDVVCCTLSVLYVVRGPKKATGDEKRNKEHQQRSCSFHHHLKPFKNN